MAHDIRITEIRNNPPGPDGPPRLNQEYVIIENAGTTAEDIVGWTLADQTPTGTNRHDYQFPARLSGGSGYRLDPGELTYVMTGAGDDVFKPANSPNDPEPRPHFDLHQNRDWFIWNNTGDTATLLDATGQFVSSMTVR